MDQNFAAAHGHVIGHHATASLAIQGANPLVKDREFHAYDTAAVADHTVANAANCGIALGHSTHQFTPRRVALGVIGGMDSDIPRPERVHNVDLCAVRILLDDVV